jgi:hypothetical protein
VSSLVRNRDRRRPQAQAGHVSAFAFTFPLTIQLLAHLGISSLAAASDITFRIAPYVPAVVPSLCTVVDAQELDEESLFDLPTTTANPCPSETPCNRALHAAVDSKTSSVVGNPRRAGGKPAATVLGGMRWCDTVAYIQQHIIAQGREYQAINFDELEQPTLDFVPRSKPPCAPSSHNTITTPNSTSQ